MIFSKLFPELQRLPTRSARHKAFSIAKAKVSMQWRYWVAVAAVVAASLYTQFSLRRIPIPWRGVARWAIVAVTVLACWGLILSFKKTIRRALWRELVNHGLPCCLFCGYDLTGNESGKCPECGRALEPS